MPIKKRGEHRRGAARKAGEGRKTGRGSVPGAGKHRDAAPAGARDEPRAFGSRKPKGSFGARDFKSRGFEPREARKSAFAGRDKPRSPFGDRKPKGASGRRDEKPRSAVGPRWRNDAPVEARDEHRVARPPEGGPENAGVAVVGAAGAVAGGRGCGALRRGCRVSGQCSTSLG